MNIVILSPVLFPVSTGILAIDSLKFSHLAVSAISFNPLSFIEKIELNVDPLPVAFPPASAPAAAAPKDSNNV